MAKLSRIHFSGMGNMAARFNPLTLDFRGPQGAPAHTVLWLRNGGGKTTMLSLFYSVILPKKSEWLGKFHEKPTQLSDYMFDREVGYILIEFSFPDGNRRIVGQSIIKRSADEVSRICFTCLADGPVTLESLPVVGLSPSPAKTREAFFDYLEAENRRNPKTVDLVKFDLAHGYGDWERHLIDIGVDPAVYRSHLVMNSDEGGLGEFFNFKTSDKFIEKLLEMADEPTSLPDDPSGVDQAEAVVDKFRSKVLSMPDLEKEARFCQQLVDGATQYRSAASAVAAAVQALNASRGEAARALFSVRASIAASEERQSVVDAQLKLANIEVGNCDATASNHTKYLQAYERLSTTLRLNEATAAHATARAASVSAENDLLILRAAERLVECDYWAAQVHFCKERFDELLANRRPEIAAVENLGATLYRRLDERVTQLAGALADTSTQIEINRGLLSEKKGQLRHAMGQLMEFQKTLAVVNEYLKGYERERRALREGGLLKEGENAPEASSRLEASFEELTQRMLRHRDEAGRLRGTARELRAEAKRQTTAATQEDLAAEGPRGHLRQAGNAEAALRSHRLIQQHGGDNADLYNPGLLQALNSQAESLSAEIVGAAVGRASDERILARHSPPHRPIFPVPLGVERVLEILRKNGVRSALPRYEWIAANCGLGEAERLLRDNPAAASGILLQDPLELPLVTQVATAEGIDTPVAVCLAGATPSTGPTNHIIIPAERGYFNVEAASASRGLIQERVNVSRQGQDLLSAKSKETTGLIERLGGYTSTYPIERLRQFRADIEGHESIAQGMREAARAADAQAESLDERAAALNDEVGRLTEERATVQSQKGRIDKYIVDIHNRLEGWRTTEKQATEGVSVQERLRGELETAITNLDAQMVALQATLNQQTSAHHQARQERDAVPEAYRRGEIQVTSVDLVSLEAEFRFKREALEKILSESGLQDRLNQAQETHGKAETKYNAFITSNALRDSDVKAARDLHPDVASALVTQEGARDEAKQVLTLAEFELNSARKAREEMPALLRDQRSTVNPEWPEAKTRTEADAAASRCREIIRKSREERDAAGKSIETLKAQLLAAKDIVKAQKPYVEDLANRAAGYAASAGHADFNPDPETVGEFLRKVRDQVDAHLRHHRDAEARADEVYHNKIESVLNDAQFATSRMETRTRILELASVRAQFDHQLDDIIENLGKRLEVITHSQAAIDAERDIVMSAMERRGSTAISLLRSAQNLSEMPPEITAWAGKAFMRFSINEKRDQAERRSYLRRLLDHWITSNVAIPSGHRMAFDCLLALVGSLDQAGKPQAKGVITVTILKPEANLRPVYHDILAMRTFSGGELVTAAIILYCVMARLRAKRRGADAHALGRDSGFLLLDNPVGKANLPDFLDLQIRIADIVGVQYICGTGINDIEALGAFPKVIRLRNSSISRSGAYVVKLDQGALNPVSAVAIGARMPILATAKKQVPA